MRSLMLASLILATAMALVVPTPAYATLVGFSFSGTWGGTLGPITAGDTISGSLTWDDASTTNVCATNPAYTICRALLSLTLTESPNTDGLSITSLSNTNVLFAGALYGLPPSGNTFEGIQINDRATDCTVVGPTCFGTFFIGPSKAGFQDFGEDETIFTTTFRSSGPSPVPEPRTSALTVTLLGLVAGMTMRRRLLKAGQVPTISRAVEGQS